MPILSLRRVWSLGGCLLLVGVGGRLHALGSVHACKCACMLTLSSTRCAPLPTLKLRPSASCCSVLQPWPGAGEGRGTQTRLAGRCCAASQMSLPSLLFPCCSFSHDSRYLAICGEQMAIDVENVETGESLGRLALQYTCVGTVGRDGDVERAQRRARASSCAAYMTVFLRAPCPVWFTREPSVIPSSLPLTHPPPGRPEDVAWNPRHHMLAHAGAHGKDQYGAEYAEIVFRFKRR